jgi:hypothetical protein
VAGKYDVIVVGAGHKGAVRRGEQLADEAPRPVPQKMIVQRGMSPLAPARPKQIDDPLAGRVGLIGRGVPDRSR